MPTFRYQARDEGGRSVRGILDAESKVVLADRLRKMGYLVTRMEEAKTGGPLLNIPLRRGPSQEEILFSALQLSNLIEAGIPLTTSLKTIADQSTAPGLKRTLTEVLRAIESGTPFSEALSHHPQVFPPLMGRLVAVGEVSGKLDVVLNRFANFLEKDLNLRRSVQSALTYPALVVVASLLLVLFVVSFVVPQFSALFEKAGMTLPGPTRILAGFGMGLRQRGWLWAGAAACFLTGARMILAKSTVRQWTDEWLLRAPLFGTVIRQILLARFARTLATLVGSGIAILGALETARQVVGNFALSREVDRVRAAVERGERMSNTLATGKIFYPDAVQMIRVGEESGRLDGMLDKVADFYELRVGYALKQMVTLLEPFLLVVTGGVVAFIMASLLLPMFDMVKLLQKGGLR